MLHVRPVESLKVETAIIRVLRQHFADPQNWSPRKVDLRFPPTHGLKTQLVLLYRPPTVAEVHKLGNFFADGISSSSFDCVLKAMAKVGSVQMFRNISYVNTIGEIYERKSESYSTNVLYLSAILDSPDENPFFSPHEGISPLLTREIPASVPEAK